ncbi:hypothetical protein [Runella limosa]|uniref:hypothetical protein n=1 Tax=Runella limosa TaxID=370978 RepID=UPI00041126B1|nr:hypothetical protein [Runella limosa]
MQLFEQNNNLLNLTDLELSLTMGGADSPKGIVQWTFYYIHYAVDEFVGASQAYASQGALSVGVGAAIR